MAVAGLSTLEAVNEILEVVNEGAETALDSTGSFPTKAFTTSKPSQVEYVLTRVSRRVQAMGWPDNTDFGTSVTPVAVTFTVTLANTVLWVRGADRSAYRNLTMRGVAGVTYLWDSDNRTNNFGSQTPISLDLINWLDFDNLQPRTKDIVVAAAGVIFQRRRRGSPDHDAFLKEEQVIAEIVGSRIDGRLTLPPINPSPEVARVLSSRGGQQGQ